MNGWRNCGSAIFGAIGGGIAGFFGVLKSWLIIFRFISAFMSADYLAHNSSETIFSLLGEQFQGAGGEDRALGD